MAKHNLTLKSIALPACIAMVVLLASACGSSASSTTAAKPTTTTAAKPTPASAINTSTLPVGGVQTSVLTDGAGYTLYYFSLDTAGKPACTASAKTPSGAPCTKVWPPLLLPSGTPSAPSSIASGITVVSTVNGRQVEYKGHPLYTYSGDTAPGQTNGEGILGKWYVVTPGIAPLPTATLAPPASTSSTSGTSTSSTATPTTAKNTTPSSTSTTKPYSSSGGGGY